MPASIVQSAAGSINRVPPGGYTVTFPNPATAGNTLFVGFRAYIGPEPPVPSGWTRDMAAGSVGPTLLYRREATGGETSVTLAIGQNFYGSHVFLEVAGLTPTPVDVVAGNGESPSATSWASPPVTPTSPSDRFLLAVWGTRIKAPSQPVVSGYTNGFTEVGQSVNSNLAPDNNVGLAVAFRAEPWMPGQQSSTATFTTAAYINAITVAYVVAPQMGLPSVVQPPAMSKPTPYQVLLGDLRTGRVIDEIPADPRWSTALNSAGTCTVDIPLTDPDVAARGIPRTALPARSFLAVVYGSVLVWAGPVWTHRYTASTGMLTLGAAGLWSLFDSRKVLPVLAASVPITDVTADTVYTGRTLATIARDLIAQAMAHTGGDLPLVLPVAASGSNDRTYRGYELTSLGDALRNLTAVINGPDLEFRPRWGPTPGFLQWEMRAGNPLLGQVGSPHVWDHPGGGVVGIDVEVSGRPVSRVHAVGSGMERAMLTSRAEDLTLVSAGWPLLEDEVARKTVEQQTTLDAWASSSLAALSRQVTAWSVTVRADVTPTLGSYSLGDDAVLQTVGDPYLSDGAHRVRIVAMASGPERETVTLTMAPTQAQV